MRHVETDTGTPSPEPAGSSDPSPAAAPGGPPAPAVPEDTPSPSPTPSRRAGLRWWREIIYILLVYLAYSAVRNQFGSGAGTFVDADPAFNHAKAIIHIERAMGLYFERSLQQWYLDLPAHGLIRFWNVYYGLFHFVVAAGALVYMFRVAPARYRLWRNTLAVTTLCALIGFASFSLMPPRLLDDPGNFGGCRVYAGASAAQADEAGDPPCDRYGYVDTVAVYGGWASFGSEEMASVSNQFAAMPSMHIGWSTWVALVMVPLIRRRWLKVVAAAYPLFTLFDIMVTANHYWIDGLGGLVCLGIGFLLARWGTRWWEARRGLAAPAPSPEPAAPSPKSAGVPG